jgi:3-oxoacyl-[acyl-carrier protein] reductase
MDLGIAGRVALVTGASKGIGRAIAAELVAEGARVAISSRSPEATGAELGVPAFGFDATDVDAAAPLVDQVEDALGGGIEILVVNTGGPPPGGDPLGFAREQWESAYRELVLTPMALVQRVVPGMRSRSWGRVLNVVSTAAREPIPWLMLSNAHRPGTMGAWKTLARGDLAREGITFNSVLPGRIATDRLADASGSLEGAARAAETDVPAGRLGTVEEMAAAAVFLCSARASYITGEALRVDGGLTRAV